MDDLDVDLDTDKKLTPAMALVHLEGVGIEISTPTLYAWARRYGCITSSSPKKSMINIDRLYRNVKAFEEERQRDGRLKKGAWDGAGGKKED